MERQPQDPPQGPREYLLAHDDAGRCCLYARPMTQDNPPPLHEGIRQSDRLSSNAVRTILGAARKADRQGEGFRVFWTFTVRDDERPAVAAGDLVLSAEIRRVLDAFKHYLLRRDIERGQVIEECRSVLNPQTRRWNTVERCYAGVRTPFEYAWVAECPPRGAKDEVGSRGTIEGTRNPHVHLISPFVWDPTPRRPGQTLRDWKRQKKAEWMEFAAYVERLWGHGWVHMEFLRVPAAAGRYMLKAAGYISKGQNEARPPEPITGQRWAVSYGVRPVRTVETVAVSDKEAYQMYAARLLAEETPRRFADMLTINRYALSAYDLDPDDFLTLVEHLARIEWLADPADPGNAEALDRAGDALARRWEILRRHEEHDAAAASRLHAFYRSLRPSVMYDPTTGAVMWAASEQEADPDPADLVPV